MIVFRIPELEATVSLADRLRSHDFTALTTGGAQWVRKALHPAEPTIKAPRIPGHGARPTATQETTSTFVIGPPTESATPGTGEWGALIEVKNDPLCPLHIIKWWGDNPETSGVGREHSTVLNQTFFAGNPVAEHTAADYAGVLNEFRNCAELYRTTALSVTGTYVGATLHDQGSIVAAQTADPGLDMLVLQNTSDARPAEFLTYALAQDVPTADSLIMGTTPYVSAAKEGFYMPYKFEHPQEWHRTDNLRRTCRLLDPPDPSNIEWNSDTMQMHPYPWGNYTGQRTFMPWLPPVDNGIGVIWIRRVAQSCSFRIILRVSVEMATRPESRFATFCEPPALPDDHALTMYYEIASRLKDAYPSRDNANNTLWDKIKSVAKGVWRVASPALSAAGFGPLVSAVDVAGAVLPKAISKFAEAGNKRLTEEQVQAQNKAVAALEAAAGPQSVNSIYTPIKYKMRRRPVKVNKGGGKPGKGKPKTKKD